MKKLLLLPFRLVWTAVKGTALAAALILLVALLMPKQDETPVTSPLSRAGICENCREHEAENAELRAEIQRLTEALNAEHMLLRRFDLRFLPGLGLDWLEIRWFPFWDDTSAGHCAQSPEGTREIIWTSMLLECSLTTLERSCTE